MDKKTKSADIQERFEEACKDMIADMGEIMGLEDNEAKMLLITALVTIRVLGKEAVAVHNRVIDLFNKGLAERERHQVYKA